jgi:threonine synthase
VVATNENDVLDEFFRTGRYRIRKEAKKTSSPSMDISKASNFERYLYDLVGRDGTRLRDLWRTLEAKGELDLANSPYYTRVAESGFVSGKSTHANRLATIRNIQAKHRVMIDPHTADGVHVGLGYREPGVPLICLETALPVKFAETIREALGREPERPAEFARLEQRPQRYELIDPDLELLKRHIAAVAI